MEQLAISNIWNVYVWSIYGLVKNLSSFQLFSFFKRPHCNYWTPPREALKCRNFRTHIFQLGIPQGSQKYPNRNIPCVSKREILIFLIYVLKNGPKLGWKEAFLALKCSWYFFVPINCKKHTLCCLFRFRRYI